MKRYELVTEEFIKVEGRYERISGVFFYEGMSELDIRGQHRDLFSNERIVEIREVI